MQTKHIPALDGVRGLAVLTVVAFHTMGGSHSSNYIVRVFGEGMRFGWSGVTLFFLLSGFLITGILYDGQDRADRLTRFYIRRTLRISPLYYATLLIVFIAVLVVHESPAPLAAYALYLQNFSIPAVRNFSPPLEINHFWSLAVEEQFYLIWPFLIFRAKTIRNIAGLCILVFLASFGYRFLVDGSSSLFARGGELAIGGLVAMAYRHHWWSKVQRSAFWVLLVSELAIAVAGSYVSLSANSSFGQRALIPLATIFWASFIVLSLTRGAVQRAMSTPLLRWFGSISYGLYIFHVLISIPCKTLAVHLIPHGSPKEHLSLAAFFTITFSIGLAWLSFRYFEQPIKKMLPAIWKRLLVRPSAYALSKVDTTLATIKPSTSIE